MLMNITLILLHLLKVCGRASLRGMLVSEWPFPCTTRPAYRDFQCHQITIALLLSQILTTLPIPESSPRDIGALVLWHSRNGRLRAHIYQASHSDTILNIHTFFDQCVSRRQASKLPRPFDLLNRIDGFVVRKSPQEILGPSCTMSLSRILLALLDVPHPHTPQYTQHRWMSEFRY
jgi:hypothetical protein